MYVWTFVIFIVAGIVMVPLTLALHDRLKTDSRALMQTSTAFGLMCATLERLRLRFVAPETRP